uniref:Uncharacterized protein n=1 Tax=Leersia perrieri TaxID=77586 RepID=A0A0D9VK79_9ORYZ
MEANSAKANASAPAGAGHSICWASTARNPATSKAIPAATAQCLSLPTPPQQGWTEGEPSARRRQVMPLLHLCGRKKGVAAAAPTPPPR